MMKRNLANASKANAAPHDLVVAAIAVAAFFLAALTAPTPASAQEQAAADAALDENPAANSDDFIPLSGENAKEMWRGYKSDQWPEGWELSDGVLHRVGGGEDLMTKDQFRNFDLRLQWKIAPGGNSGILYRVSTGDPQPYYSGLEYQILDNQRHADGKSSLTSAAALYALYAPDPNPVKPAGQWNRARIVVRGNRVRHFLNGKKVVDAVIGSDDWNERLAKSKFADWEKFAKNAKGYITLQDHGNEVWYRNVRIKPLGRQARAAAE